MINMQTRVQKWVQTSASAQHCPYKQDLHRTASIGPSEMLVTPLH
jgi:hypothetical protein